MNAEITYEAFYALLIVRDNPKDISIEQGENYRKTIWRSKGVLIIELENFLSCVTQYYIQDINS